MTAQEPKLLTATCINNDTWKIKKCKLKAQLPDLNDLEADEGKLNVMVDKLHLKIGESIGKTKDELHELVGAL